MRLVVVILTFTVLALFGAFLGEGAGDSARRRVRICCARTQSR
jgi:hypothetical protein